MFQSNTCSKLFVLLGSAFMAVALFAATAQARTPAPGYEQFAGCPSPEENPHSTLCVHSTITGGHFQMGSKDVPIEKPIPVSGGVDVETGHLVFNSKGGLTPVKQKVPGGVVGLTGLTFLLELFGVEALTLYATTELAATPGNPVEEPFTLPVKVHLTNPAGLLGNNCYVGSASTPITLNLITKTTSPPPPNEPITGVEPEQSFDESKIIFHFNNGEYVDNSFAAPGASGCQLVLFGFIPISINGLVNEQSGLPAPAGTNETRQKFNSEATLQGIVYP